MEEEKGGVSMEEEKGGVSMEEEKYIQNTKTLSVL